MIFTKAISEGRNVLLVGLVEDDIQRMEDGEPIEFDLARVGYPKVKYGICLAGKSYKFQEKPKYLIVLGSSDITNLREGEGSMECCHGTAISTLTYGKDKKDLSRLWSSLSNYGEMLICFEGEAADYKLSLTDFVRPSVN